LLDNPGVGPLAGLPNPECWRDRAQSLRLPWRGPCQFLWHHSAQVRVRNRGVQADTARGDYKFLLDEFFSIIYSICLQEEEKKKKEDLEMGGWRENAGQTEPQTKEPAPAAEETAEKF
jgi:hypothetical protein